MCIIAIALSTAVMIIALATVSGFQNGIKEKVTGLHGHIIIDNVENVESGEPVPLDRTFADSILTFRKISEIKSVAICAVRPCIAKGENEIDGMLAKGVETDYDFDFIKKHLVKGNIPDFKNDSNQVLISDVTAARLGIALGDPFQAIFFKTDTSTGNPKPKAINPTVCGIFSTGLEDFDKSLFITHYSVIKKGLNVKNSFTHAEINLKDPKQAEAVAAMLQIRISPQFMQVRTAQRYDRQIFDWLSILDTNVVVILCIMMIVAVFNMCTMLLIMITEKSSLIGTFKALGARNAAIKNIFVYKALYVTCIGLVFGNILGIGLCWLQQKFGFIKLNVETYYVNKVLVQFNFGHILLLNISTLVICALILYLPAIAISRLSPIKTIKFQ